MLMFIRIQIQILLCLLLKSTITSAKFNASSPTLTLPWGTWEASQYDEIGDVGVLSVIYEHMVTLVRFGPSRTSASAKRLSVL